MSGMKTAIFKGISLDEARHHAGAFLQEPSFKQVGRLVCIQSPTLDKASIEDLVETALTFGLPLVKVADMAAFEEIGSVKQLALGPAR